MPANFFPTSLYPKGRRSSCRCDKCCRPCTTGQPGFLVPDDLPRMGVAHPTIFEGTMPSDLLRQLPSDELPVVVPAVRENGECVFYEPRDGSCRVYAEAPFGCRHITWCQDPPIHPAELAMAMEDTFHFFGENGAGVANYHSLRRTLPPLETWDGSCSVVSLLPPDFFPIDIGSPFEASD